MKISNGLWSIFGMLAFFTIEKIFPDDEINTESEMTLKELRPKKKAKSKKTNKKSSQSQLKINSKRFFFLQSFKVS